MSTLPSHKNTQHAWRDSLKTFDSIPRSWGCARRGLGCSLVRRLVREVCDSGVSFHSGSQSLCAASFPEESPESPTRAKAIVNVRSDSKSPKRRLAKSSRCHYYKIRPPRIELVLATTCPALCCCALALPQLIPQSRIFYSYVVAPSHNRVPDDQDRTPTPVTRSRPSPHLSRKLPPAAK